MKYIVNSYDDNTNTANVTFQYNFQGTPQTFTDNFKNVPVEDEIACDAWALEYIQAYKAGLKASTKILINKLKSLRTVVDN